MDVFDSLEMRWFLTNDDAVEAARRWFATTEPEAQRLDDYLLTGRDDLGFKVRGQADTTKVETKYRLGSLGSVSLAPGVTGKLERWRKLSLTVADAELQGRGTWIAVHKLRRLQDFAYDGKAASRVPLGTRLDAGCGFELTELTYRLSSDQAARACTTLGLEAFGKQDLLLESLQNTVRVTFGAGLELRLGDEGSMSYPEWLASLGNGS